MDPFEGYFKIDSPGNVTNVRMVPGMFTDKMFKLPEYMNILFSCSRVDELHISLSPAVMYDCIADEVIMSSQTMYNRLYSDGLLKITVMESNEEER